MQRPSWAGRRRRCGTLPHLQLSCARCLPWRAWAQHHASCSGVRSGANAVGAERLQKRSQARPPPPLSRGGRPLRRALCATLMWSKAPRWRDAGCWGRWRATPSLWAPPSCWRPGRCASPLRCFCTAEMWVSSACVGSYACSKDAWLNRLQLWLGGWRAVHVVHLAHPLLSPMMTNGRAVRERNLAGMLSVGVLLHDGPSWLALSLQVADLEGRMGRAVVEWGSRGAAAPV